MNTAYILTVFDHQSIVQVYKRDALASESPTSAFAWSRSILRRILPDCFVLIYVLHISS